MPFDVDRRSVLTGFDVGNTLFEGGDIGRGGSVGHMNSGESMVEARKLAVAAGPGNAITRALTHSSP